LQDVVDLSWSVVSGPLKLSSCGLTIINDDSKVVNMLEAPLTDNARVVIYDRHMFIVQAIGRYNFSLTVNKQSVFVPSTHFQPCLILAIWL
jgi:hypothetical protein